MPPVTMSRVAYGASQVWYFAVSHATHAVDPRGVYPEQSEGPSTLLHKDDGETDDREL
jgi:hypothetical protein